MGVGEGRREKNRSHKCSFIKVEWDRFHLPLKLESNLCHITAAASLHFFKSPVKVSVQRLPVFTAAPSSWVGHIDLRLVITLKVKSNK